MRALAGFFEWDDAKRQANRSSTGVRAAATGRGKPRWIATGYIGNRLHVAVYAMRGVRRRVISLRRANAREVRRYAEAQA